MISTEIRLFHLNRILLIIVGLWPSKQSNLVRLQQALIIGILLSFIVFQASRFQFIDCTFDFIARMLSTELLFMIFVIKYIAYWINAQDVKYYIQQLQCIYEELKDEKEIAILEKYCNNAKNLTTKATLLITCSLISLVFLTYTPYILDIVMSKNGTYVRRYAKFWIKYYEVQETYFHFIALHFNVAFCIGDIALLATGTMDATYLIRLCGMFKIASYRIKRDMTINMFQNVGSRSETVMYKEIISAIDIHRKAMQLATAATSGFEISYLIIIVTAVLCLSLNLFRTLQIMSIAAEMIEGLILHLVIIIGIFFGMFFINYVGQEVINHNNHVYFTAYNVEWYLAPLYIQKLILFLLQRSSKVFILSIGGLFPVSLELFASLASTSMSYFTVMLSVQ